MNVTQLLQALGTAGVDYVRNAAQIEQWNREKGMLASALREPQTGGAAVDVLVRPEVPFEELSKRATGICWTSPRCRRSSVAKTPMSDALGRVGLDEQLLRRRLQAFEDNCSFFIQMWLQNPRLAARAGPRIAGLLSPLTHSLPSSSQTEQSS